MTEEQTDAKSDHNALSKNDNSSLSSSTQIITIYMMMQVWSMSETFQFIAMRAKEHPQIIRRSQMSKQAFFSSRTTGEKRTEYSYALTPRTSLPIISA
jgi:hypothetical protein